jgi:Zn-dependent protease with chaperone function
MMRLRGYWYDGRSSAQVAACCCILDNGAVQVRRLADGRVLKDLPDFAFQVSARLADTPRVLRLEGGESFESLDNEALDALLSRLGRLPRQHAAHRLERRWGWAAAALALLLVCAWGAGRFGIPAAARLIALRLPGTLLERAEADMLATLDRLVFGPTRITREEQERLQRRFAAALAADAEPRPRLLLRQGRRAGANAFALPAGAIVFTDELIALAQSDEELLAVLFHEIGHVVHRHGLRNAIQDAMLSFALLAVTGDVAGSAELFLGLPVLLTQFGYSRQFEREADRYALARLQAGGNAPGAFGSLLRRIEAQARQEGGNPERRSAASPLDSYLATHPPTEERLRPFEERSP